MEESEITGKQRKWSQNREGRKQHWDKWHMMTIWEVWTSSANWGNWSVGCIGVVLESWREVSNQGHPEYLLGWCGVTLQSSISVGMVGPTVVGSILCLVLSHWEDYLLLRPPNPSLSLHCSVVTAWAPMGLLVIPPGLSCHPKGQVYLSSEILWQLKNEARCRAGATWVFLLLGGKRDYNYFLVPWNSSL